MRFTSSLLALGLLASTATAKIIPNAFVQQLEPGTSGTGAASGDCLPKGVASSIVNSFVSLITAFNPGVANTLLAANFSDTSASINFLASLPLNATTFPSKGAFIGGQGAQPPVPLQVLSVDAVTCDGVIVFRWIANVGANLGLPNPQPVKGINVLYATYTGGIVNGTKVADPNPAVVGPSGWQLKTVFSEFNSAAWVVALGGTCATPARPGA